MTAEAPHAPASPATCSADALPASPNKGTPTDSQYVAEVSCDLSRGLQEILKLTALSLDTELGPTQRGYIEQIKVATQSLLGQVETLLDIACLQSGALGLEQIPFNPAVLLADLASAIVANAQAQGCSLSCDLASDLPTRSQGDPGRIRQILTTLTKLLFANCPGDNLCIQTRRLASDDPRVDWVRFSLFGLGQTPDELRRLFAPSPPPKTLISQLGCLACLQIEICRRLIEHLGGWIWIDDQSPTTLHIGLPLLRLASREPLLPPSGHWHGKRALIVDDHSETRRTLVYWLKEWEFAVEEASSGTRALELARQQAFDLYIFDAVLPEIDGFELAQRLRSEGLAERAALVMLASLGQRGDAERCRSLGIDAFLMKPTTPPELRALLGQVLAADRPAQDAPLITRHIIAEHRPRLRILFIEGDPIHQKLAAALFQQGGHDPVMVADRQMGLACLKAGDYDLVFVDLGPPEQITAMIAEIAKETTLTSLRPPLIGMLSPGTEYPEISGLAERISKPLTPTTLEELIRRLLQAASGAGLES
ncbi:response regulator [Caldichromatium japonicum]|uniref:Response regulator n=1 Tax=Caldichromatium japonicum TaxID=2699430 RepID=A0A6G7VCH1_9GAMM|nr:response regulator [Caldichromatium japonicum]QIK37575.1 response regulator [Caldichromatium japonicum]